MGTLSKHQTTDLRFAIYKPKQGQMFDEDL